ncbi:MAG TPA: Lrp/AsnC family transcriptional regulator [Azospirillaceae bacterium]|nr:Lrp/AsnC family transcriptional regulator [Azospirillaceae bacterium]
MSETTTQPLDETDGRILAVLEANGRETATRIAALVGLSRSAVQERVARLERDGVIQGYTVRLGAAARPPGLEAYLTLRLNGAVCPRIAPLLKAMPEILSIESLAGELDMIVKVRCPDMAALSAVRDRISRIRDVKSVTTAPVLAVHLDRR